MDPKRFFIVLSAVAVLSVVASGYVFYQVASGFQAKETKISRVLADTQVLEDQSDLVQSLKKNFEANIAPKLAALDKALPSKKDEVGIITELQSLQKRTKATIGAPTFPTSDAPSATSQTQSANGALALAIKFTASGTYAQMQAVIQGLENFPQECDVVSVVLTPGTGDSINGDFNVNMFLKP